MWLYTNFDCNLSCDYCCAQSGPRARARRLDVDVARRACEEFAGFGGREVLLTGGEPFLHPQLSVLAEIAGERAAVTILTNAMLLERGSRRRILDALDAGSVTMQVSVDSAGPGLHDAHRGAGSFERARAGIELLRARGFTVKVAATIDEADAAEEVALRAMLDADGIARADQLVRRVAHTGFADHGMRLSIDALWPEPTLAADGAWWHPVGIADPAMQVSSTPLPLATTLAVIHATMNAGGADRATALQAFRCT
ncbi:MAG: radical SAM protein [Solirubrobacteraceae bacterium]